MTTDSGRSPDGSGYSAEPEPSCTVSAVPMSIPNAAWLFTEVRRAIESSSVSHEPLLGSHGRRSLGYYMGCGIDYFGHDYSRHDLLLNDAATIAIVLVLEEAARLAAEHACCGCDGAHGSCMIDDVPLAIANELRELAIAIETRQGGDVKQAPSRSDESAGRQASPRSSRPSSDKERE